MFQSEQLVGQLMIENNPCINSGHGEQSIVRHSL